MSTISQQMDSIIAGGSAAETVGLPDNMTSPDVDADGMLPKETYWQVYISASWTDQRSFVGCCCQYADANSAKFVYMMNALEAKDFAGPFDGADWVSVRIAEPGRWTTSHVEVRR